MSCEVELTIAMAAFNEEKNISIVLEEDLKILDQLNLNAEVLVIDDGSTDSTNQIVTDFIKKDSRVRCFRHEKNLGIKAFNRRMLDQANGKWVLFTSADGECDLSQLGEWILRANQENLDAVLAFRESKRYTLFRKFVSLNFKYLVKFLFGVYFKDAGTMRMLRRDFYLNIPLYSQSAFINAERLLVGHRLGSKYVELATQHKKRLSGKGKGAQWRWVLASFLDLLRVRIKYFQFDKNYSQTR